MGCRPGDNPPERLKGCGIAALHGTKGPEVAPGPSSTVTKRGTCHTSRHRIATHLLLDGHDIRTAHEVSAQRDMTSAMVYTHVLNQGPNGVRSPMDPI